MTEEKKDVTQEYIHREYVGKELKKKGEKDGKEWKLFQLKFEVGREYPFTVNAWSTLGTKEDAKSLKVTDLEEGEYYTIGYNLTKEAFEAHGKWHDSRECFYIKRITEEEATKKMEEELKKGSNTTSKPTPAPTNSLDPLNNDQVEELRKKLEKFDIAFKKKLTEEDKLKDYTKEQFVSAVFLYLHKEEAKTAIIYWNASRKAEEVKAREEEEVPEDLNQPITEETIDMV